MGPCTRNAGDTPLSRAAGNGFVRIVKTLIENGADVNASHYLLTSLHCAAHRGHSEVVEFLIQNGAEIDTIDTLSKQTALNKAAENGYVKVVEILLKYGARTDVKDEHGQTPLESCLYEANYGRIRNNIALKILKMLAFSSK